MLSTVVIEVVIEVEMEEVMGSEILVILMETAAAVAVKVTTIIVSMPLI